MSNSINQQNVIYAILADSVYWDVRYGIDPKTGMMDTKNSNWTPVPSDWKLIKELSGSGDVGRASNTDLQGFTARGFKNSNFS